MLSVIKRGILLYAISWVSWRLLRRFFVKTDLDNLPGPEPASLLQGNFGELFHFQSWGSHKYLADHFGRFIRIYGPLRSSQLYVFDPKALHHIIVKDQNIFEEPPAVISNSSLFFGEGILASLGERHRKQRKMLNPVFSVAHMRNMVPMFNDVAKKLEQAIKFNIARGRHEIDILHWMSRAALEMIGQSGLGYSFDSLVEGAEPHPYSKAAKELVPVSSAMAFEMHFLLPLVYKIGSPRFRRFLVDLIPSENVRRLRDIVNTMDQTTIQIFNEKKKALAEGDEALLKQVGQAKDIMSILMKANMEADEADRLPDDQVLGQMSSLTFAATDTTSNALSRILYLLSIHPEAQDRLRAEVTACLKTHGSENIPYDELVALPFMDAICRETLRLYPPVPTVVRTARQDAVVPLLEPIRGRDGREIHSVLVPKDTSVFISILNANRDPTLWGADALEWKPERWLSPLPQALQDAHVPGIYSHLMTFLGGGRACIGFKFSQLEMKVVLSTLISHFRFSLSDREIDWVMSGIVTPTVKGSLQPQLPLRVELVEMCA
ncbi:putative cytochrome P450 family protein [Lyophyllum shimeji]|uniref:Cytochrome P450 family protein n=1 Tax=Lyophyllum shimeji TaxID=47721 RepID=A0A9P3PUR4_LYOSH|nr:putative cytochrome P450 family protein [Lyophyllum shimeji]